MSRHLLPWAIVGLNALLAWGCADRRAEPPADLESQPAPAVAGDLNAADVDMFLAVRAKALTRLEEGLTDVEAQGGSVLRGVVELADAEKDASAGLGFEWRRFRWVREEIARLQSAQRAREDSAMLTVELRRARDDLLAQLKLARDAASRQFLEAQVASLDRQLDALAGEAQASEADASARELIARVRAELAVQQGRQERIQKRLRELLQRERAGGAAATPPPA